MTDTAKLQPIEISELDDDDDDDDNNIYGKNSTAKNVSVLMYSKVLCLF